MQILQKINKYKKQVSLCLPAGEGSPKHPAWAALLSPAQLQSNIKAAVLKKKKENKKEKPTRDESFIWKKILCNLSGPS